MRPDKKSRQERERQKEDRQQKQPQTQQSQSQTQQTQQQKNQTPQPQPQKQTEVETVQETVSSEEAKEEIFHPNSTKLPGLTVVGMIDKSRLDSLDENRRSRRRRRRKRVDAAKVDISGNAQTSDKNRGSGKQDKNKGGKSDRDGNNKDRNNGGGNNNNNKKDGGRNQDRRDRDGKNGKPENDKKDGSGKSHRRDKGDRWKAPELTEDDIKKQVKETNALLNSPKGKTFASKRRRDRRDEERHKEEVIKETIEKEKKILKITEFLTADELATLMDVPVTKIIAACFDLGRIISINQRLDAELIEIITEFFGFEVQFVDSDASQEENEEEDKPEDLKPRPPIVTIMGHVDHGKTKLLDYIRNTNVVAGEAGGITQHIGAYNVELPDGKHITFLDTPGHAAFTAMRARGAKLTDIAVIVVAADDGIMPQTEEAIAHAQAAGVPIVFAINKIDKPSANPEKIKEELAAKNFLVEDWGGKYGSVEISAKQGTNVDKLLERILLEAEMLELKANYNKTPSGTVVEAMLDKGRGYVATVIVEHGVLKVGDVVLAGTHSGKIRAMFNERGKKIKEARPAEPAVLLGLDGAPSAGDKFKVMPDERTAREKATQREMLGREMSNRTAKHLTLEEIGRRIALGSFQELNIVLKGDTQGTIEALQDSLERLSTEEIQVKVIAKGVGQISENDIMLATASNAVIIGFQVRPSSGAKKLAEKDQIDIKLYSIIYDAIDDIKKAMEGMLSPEVKEEITGTAEVLQTFEIAKVGKIAGCMVKDGKIVRSNKCRVIRDGIVIFTGELESLKHFKDDVPSAAAGTECGLNVAKFNDILVGDVIESYEEKVVAKKLE